MATDQRALTLSNNMGGGGEEEKREISWHRIMQKKYKAIRSTDEMKIHRFCA